MTEYSMTIKCESREELDELLARLDCEVQTEEKPAKKAKAKEDEPADDEKPAKKAKKEETTAEDLKDEVRAALRKLSEATDRKTAMKILNKYAESVDEVDDGALEELKEKIEAAIEAA